jgi:multiple sugar transport system substrate-binding protein
VIDRRLTRRGLLHLGGAAGAGMLLAACAPQVVKETVVVQQTVVVEKTTEVEKVVKETVVVEKTKEVEKIITAEPAPAEKITMEIWENATDNDLEAVKTVAKNWNDQNPLAQVSVVQTPFANQTLQKLMAAIASNTAPDIAHVDMFTVVSWAARLAWEDLSPLAEAEKLDVRKEFFDWIVNEGSYNNRLYALGTLQGHQTFYWNKKHFRDAGLDPERPPQSAEELWEYADKLDQKSNGRYSRIGFDPMSGILMWAISFFWAGCSKDAPADFNPFYDYKGQKCTANSEKIVEALKWKVAGVKRYGIGELEGFRSSFDWGEQDPLGQGLVSMRLGGTWLHNMLGEYFPDLEWGVGPTPIPEQFGGTSLGACMGPEGYSVPRGALARGHLQQAYQFLRFISSPEQNMILQKAGDWLPCRPDMMSDPWYKRTPQMEFFVSMLPCGWNRPTIPEGNLLWTSVETAEDKAVHDQGEPQQLLDEVAQSVD